MHRHYLISGHIFFCLAVVCYVCQFVIMGGAFTLASGVVSQDTQLSSQMLLYNKQWHELPKHVAVFRNEIKRQDSLNKISRQQSRTNSIVNIS